MSPIVELNADVRVPRVDPIGFWQLGREYLQARRAVRVAGKRFSPVPYFLTCRVLELEFKAFLLAHGRSMRFVANRGVKGKGVGHDLKRALAEAEALGLGKVVRVTRRRRQESFLAPRSRGNTRGNKPG